jgi:hypothetical protein
MPHLARAAALAALLILAAAMLAIAAFMDGAYAFDSEKWGADAATRQWFKSLRNGNGLSCCDFADGARIEDPDWRELDDGSAEVFAKGAWHVIPPDKVLKGTNRVGYPILWWPNNWPEPSCFLPGSKG